MCWRAAAGRVFLQHAARSPAISHLPRKHTRHPSPQVRRLIPNPTAKHNFPQLLSRAEGDKARVGALADLLERMMALDPEKRIDPDAALRHPFVKVGVGVGEGCARVVQGGVQGAWLEMHGEVGGDLGKQLVPRALVKRCCAQGTCAA